MIDVKDLSVTEARQSTAPVTIAAHQNELAAVALNQQGTMVATASNKVQVSCTVLLRMSQSFSALSSSRVVFTINTNMIDVVNQIVV